MNKVLIHKSLYGVFLIMFTVQLSFAQFNVNAGLNKTICIGDSVQIGSFSVANGGKFPYTYSWLPTSGLDNPKLSNPLANPTVTTTYILTVKDLENVSVNDTIVVTVGQIPKIYAGKDTTIQEGSVAILHGTGGATYYWTSTEPLKYPKTANPELEPIKTKTVFVEGKDITRACSAKDSVIVIVKPNDKIVLYNTFTPNNDNDNDEWYIGNIDKYKKSHLEVYNRYGKIVFKADGYSNDWDGSAFGEALPPATYFYVLDLGDNKGIYKGTVTIIY